MKYTASALTVLFLCIPSTVFALGLSATPSKLDITLTENSTEAKVIQVTNTSSDVALFDVYPDELRRVVTVTPSSFMLEAGETQKVSVEATSDKEGVYTTHVSVVARALSDNVVSASGGVKIPLDITVVEKNTAQLAVSGMSGRLVDSFVVGVTAFLIILNLAMLLYLQARKLFSQK